MEFRRQLRRHGRRNQPIALRRPRISASVAALAVFLGCVIQPTRRFVYDAATYWRGAMSLAHGHDPYLVGGLSLRGVLTSVLYLPAALSTRAFGDGAAGTSVLVENSLLVTILGVVLLPRVLRAWVPVTRGMVLVSAGLTWLVVGRFAPYPLTDLWAAVLLIATVAALQRRSPVGFAVAGLCVGAAFNIRPAYLLAVLLAVAVVLWRERLAGLWFAAGALFALVPQSIFNLTHAGGWEPWPPRMTAVMQIQATFASYVIRYDTVAFVRAPDPRQFFCSPSMAAAIGDHPPASTGGLAVMFMQDLPTSLPFAVEKLAAVMHWPLAAPYFGPTGSWDTVFALLVTTVSLLGAVALVCVQAKTGFRHAPVAVVVAGAAWIASAATVVTSTPETRFALPLVLFGVVGCAAATRVWLGLRWGGVAVAAVALVFAAGVLGLSHSAQPGNVTPGACATR